VSVSRAARSDTASSFAGLIASLALFVSLIGIVHRPVRVIPAAIVLSLIAAAIGGRHHRLALAAMLVTSLAFVLGMAVAVWGGRPLW
jgi:hypothetical protein